MTLPPYLPDGPIDVASVRALDDRLRAEAVPETTPETAQIVFIDGPDGDRLQLRLHGAGGDWPTAAGAETPGHAAPADAAILWIHGGGLFLGSADRDDAICQALAQEHGVAVVAVDYRLAPEHPYPAALEDCYAALRWTTERFGRGDDARGRVVVIGESAGGGLAAALSLLARDRGRTGDGEDDGGSGPRVTAQLLHYPMLDDRGETPSCHTLAQAPVWNRRLNAVGWGAYLGGQPAKDLYAAAARADDDDLPNLPPTYLEVGELDLFRDEVIAFGARLAAAGNTVELHVDAGAVHGFDRVAPDATISRIAAARRARFTRRALHGELQGENQDPTSTEVQR